MYEVGEKLKDARMSKGYTLDDMQQITKIQKRYLTAIEDGHFEILPGDFYTRAFIKQYGDSVGLDGDQLVREYSGSSAHQSYDQNQDRQSEVYSRIKSNKGGAWMTVKDSMPIILIIVLVIAIIIAIYVAASRMSGSEEQMINNQSSETVFISNGDETENEASEESEDEPASEDEEQSLELEETTDTTMEYTVTGTHPEDQVVELQAEGGETWVSVELDGEVVESGMLEDGQSFEINFDNETSEVQLVIGNAPVTNVALNGETVDYAEDIGDIVRQEVTFSFE